MLPIAALSTKLLPNVLPMKLPGLNMTEELQAVGWIAVKGRLRFKPAVLQVCDYVYLDPLVDLLLQASLVFFFTSVMD